MTDFKIEFLDHVALRVKDMEASASWYEKVFGLKRHQPPEWGEYPIFMVSGKTGIALFPAEIDNSNTELNLKNIKIDHFAFNVTKVNFEKAIKKFNEFGLDFHFQDHIYFHSIYTKDLDGHTIELTTMVKDKKSFYENNSDDNI